MDSTPTVIRQRKFDPCVRRIVDEMLLPLPGVRAGYMFGYPAYYMGRRLFACHYGAQVAVKVPDELSESLLCRGIARPFEPNGRRMHGWIAVALRRAVDFHRCRAVFLAARRFAGTKP